MSNDDEKNRKAILARRARFIAAALTATSGCDQVLPRPCLEPPIERPGDGQADEWAEQRARVKAEEDAAAARRADAGAPPLESQIPESRYRDLPARDPISRPKVCLSIQVIRQPAPGADAGQAAPQGADEKQKP